jgi:predicted PurR-regulated permease PerM
LSALLIAFGYVAIVGSFGWWGLLAAVAHIGILLALTRPRR